MKNNLSQFILVVLLLLVQLFIRIHHAEVQEVFIDEGYHVTRGAIVYDFKEHPGRFSQGKLLLYFWLGIFETNSLIALPVSRISIGLFSLINGAALYQLGRYIHSPLAGLVALAMYAVLPFAFFFERMVLADPFAAAFMSLSAWRSLIFVKRPALREGFILGTLLALATLAKLTMTLMPILPVAASFIYCPHWRTWINRYLPSLIFAGIIFTLIWLPILIPAAFAANTDKPFIIVNPENLQQIAASDPGEKTEEILPELMAYTTPWLMLGMVVAVFYLSFNLQTRKIGLFFLIWLLLITFLSIVAAKVVRARYLMPVASPMVLIVAYIGLHFWRKSNRVIQGGMMLAIVAWLVGFALPFTIVAATRPADLPLGSGEWNRYMSGRLSGAALREAADTLNAIEPGVKHVYSTWGTCQLLYFYTETDVTCLPVNVGMETSLKEFLERDIIADDVAYVVLNGADPLTDMAGYRWKFVAGYKRPNINRPVEIWKITRF